jgi:hypothetical protein
VGLVIKAARVSAPTGLSWRGWLHYPAINFGPKRSWTKNFLSINIVLISRNDPPRVSGICDTAQTHCTVTTNLCQPNRTYSVYWFSLGVDRCSFFYMYIRSVNAIIDGF